MITDEAHRWVDERAELRELGYSAATYLGQPMDGYFSWQFGFAVGQALTKAGLYVATDCCGQCALPQATVLKSRAKEIQ
jgi:hypothetical protein